MMARGRKKEIEVSENRKPRTEKDENLDEIIEHTDAAKSHLKRASRVAESSGDKDGAKEIDEAAEKIEKIEKKYEGIRDKKSG
jgi:DNA-binding ferritin-like protein